MKRHTTALAAKVAARNEVNALADAAYAPIAGALRPFVDQKILKADGTLLDKVKRALPPLVGGPDAPWQSWYSVPHGYSLILNLKTCHAQVRRDCDFAHYAEEAVYVGDIKNGILVGILPPYARRTDYTEDEIIEGRAAVEVAKQALRDAERAIADFGPYDV